MIIAWYMKEKFVQEEITDQNRYLVNDAIWLDLINPTAEEERLLEQNLNINIPTREEMREIELSSRLYKEDDILFMTATMVAHSESTTPDQDAVTFLLTPKHLITLRYIKPQAFKLFALRIPKLHITTPNSMFIELLDAAVDRFADILEMISRQLDLYSKEVFKPKSPNSSSHHQLLQKLGINGELNSKIVESLVSFNRLISFFEQYVGETSVNNDHAKILTINRDIYSLSDHATFLSNKISFLLEATLGMVQIEQNAIIKIFSVAAVIFLPPTLIASIYGMNFSTMPELTWKYGYVVALGLMVFAAWLPFKYFKYRKWL